MKKVITIIFASLLALSALTACNTDSDGNTAVDSAVEIQQESGIIGVWEGSSYNESDQKTEYGTLTLNNDGSCEMEGTDSDNIFRYDFTGTYIKDGDNLTITIMHAKTYNIAQDKLVSEEDIDPNDEAYKGYGTLKGDNSLSLEINNRVTIFTKAQ